MLEKLKEYREQFVNEKLEIETANDERYIAEKVQEYENQLRKTLAEERAKAVSDKQKEIEVIDKLIALEAEKSLNSVDCVDDFLSEQVNYATTANPTENAEAKI